MVDGAEGQTIRPAAAEVSNVNVLHREDSLFQCAACIKYSSGNIYCLCLTGRQTETSGFLFYFIFLPCSLEFGSDTSGAASFSWSRHGDAAAG